MSLFDFEELDNILSCFDNYFFLKVNDYKVCSVKQS